MFHNLGDIASHLLLFSTGLSLLNRLTFEAALNSFRSIDALRRLLRFAIDAFSQLPISAIDTF